MAGKKGYQWRRYTEQTHRKRLENPDGWHTEIIEVELPEPRYHNGGEPTVVAGWQLANVLRAWMSQWRAERPIDNKSPGSTEANFMGAVEFLSFHTGIDPRRINGLVRSEFPVVGEKQAESVLMAIDKEFLLHTEIKVMPNPGWDLEKWIAWRAEQGC